MANAANCARGCRVVLRDRMATLRRRSALFVCDLQERFAHVVANFPDIVRSARLMVDVCRTMRIPIVVTEQVGGRLYREVGLVVDRRTEPGTAWQDCRRPGPARQCRH